MEKQNISEIQKENRKKLPGILKALESSGFEKSQIKLLEEELNKKEPFKNLEANEKYRKLLNIVEYGLISTIHWINEEFQKYLKMIDEKEYICKNIWLSFAFIKYYFWPGDWLTDNNNKDTSEKLWETLD